MTDPVTTAADRLYELPPHQFVAERTAAAAQARAAGDPETATALGKLRRPTVAAWLVNLLALRRPELLAQLTELATAFHQAQQDLDGAQLRELTTRRRTTVAELVAAARTLALAADPAMSAGKLPLAELERTLGAALTDPASAAAVRSGRLTHPVTAAEEPELPRPRPRLRLVPDPDQPGPSQPGTASGDQPPDGSAAAALAELAAARQAAAQAEVELDRVSAEQRDAQQALREIDAALAALTARRAAAAQRLAEVEAAGLAARRAAKAARRRAGEAAAAVPDHDG